MKHLKYGGSTAGRTLHCPAWHALQEELPAPPANARNDAADVGTLCHNAMEKSFKTSTPLREILDAGMAYNGHHLTQELLDEKCIPAEEAILDLLQKYDIQDWQCEPFVQIDGDIGGSIDFLGISGDKKTILIADYKFGFVNVSAENNAQLKFYALAAATDPCTQSLFDSAEKIVMAVIQPNDNGPDLDEWSMDMDALDAFETDYFAAVEASEDPTAEPTAGDWCRFCPAHAICPAKTGLAAKATRITKITADKLAEYLPMAEQLETWAKEVKKLAHEQLELGTPITGYKLVNKRARRVWNDPKAVGDKIRKAKKIKLEDGFTLALKSPAQLEKTAKTLNVNWSLYEPFISSLSSGTTLARESDKRPAALPVQGLAQLNDMRD